MIFFFRTLFFSALVSISILAVLPDYNALPPLASLSDLLNHAAAFTLLTLLYGLSYQHPPKQIAGSLIAYGVMIEMVQAFLPTRYASVEDILADSVGILLGLSITKLINFSTLFNIKSL